MTNDTDGTHLLETSAQRVAREKSDQERADRKQHQRQLWFNGVLAAATVLTLGAVLYQSSVLKDTLTEMVRQSKAAEDAAKAANDAVAVARDTLTSGNDSFNKTLLEMKKQSTSASISAFATKSASRTAADTLRVSQRAYVITGAPALDAAKKSITVSLSISGVSLPVKSISSYMKPR